MKLVAITGLLVILTGCSREDPDSTCPDPIAVAPQSIGGESYVRELTQRLAGPDRENTITAAIKEIHKGDPSLDGDMVLNILITADCPNAASRPYHDAAADNARIADFRAQIDQLLNN